MVLDARRDSLHACCVAIFGTDRFSSCVVIPYAAGLIERENAGRSSLVRCSDVRELRKKG